MHDDRESFALDLEMSRFRREYGHCMPFEDARVKLEYDLYYAKNYSPFLDLLILLQTVRVVLWPDGAR